MAFEYAQHERASPPPAYVDAAPGGMESEMYIDGTLYVNGVAVPIDLTERAERLGRAHGNRIRVKHFSAGFEVNLRAFWYFSKAPLSPWTELWATQQTERIDRQQHKDKYVRTTLRELIIYMIFLTILSIGR